VVAELGTTQAQGKAAEWRWWRWTGLDGVETRLGQCRWERGYCWPGSRVEECSRDRVQSRAGVVAGMREERKRTIKVKACFDDDPRRERTQALEGGFESLNRNGRATGAILARRTRLAYSS
jgi:hypothetical protein